MDKVSAIRIKYTDGTYSNEIPIGVLAGNVKWDSTHTLIDVLGSVDISNDGSIQEQIDQLFNNKVDESDIQNYVTNQMATYVTDWLQDNIDSTGQTVAIDSSLMVEGAAADAKAAGQIVQISATQPTKNNNRIWVGTAEEQYEVPTMNEFNQVEADIDELKTDLSYLAEEATGFFPASFFVRGQIDNGNNGSYYQNRISFSSIHQYDRPITLEIKDGYNYKVSFYDESGTYISQYGYRTDSFTIGANQNFKITIGHTGNVDADHSVPADINILRQVLTYTLQINEDIRFAQGQVIRFTLLDIPMEMGNLAYGKNDDNAYDLPRRMRTTGYIPVVAGDVITNSITGIKYSVHMLDYNGLFKDESGWQTGEYVIPYDGLARIVFVQTSDGVLADVIKPHFRHGISIETNALSHWGSVSTRIASIDPNVSKPYYYSGEKIDAHKYGYSITPLWNFSNPTTFGNFSKQASAYNNGVVFKCFNPDLMQLYEFDTGTKLAEFSIVSGHGDSIDFSNEYYEASDEFPLCYITADTTPAKVYVNRVTRSGATLIRTLIFPSDKTGYYAGHCLDSINNVLYQFGYKNEDYQTTSNGNHIIASKWDLANLNDNGDGTYTPTFIDTFDLPFMNTAQGQVMLNGKVFIMSSNPYVDTGTTEKTKVYVVDVGGQRVSNILTDFIERIRDHEGEGVFFIPNGNKYDLIVDVQATGLYKITF